MTDMQDHNGLPEDELLAAEYALGVLSGPDRAPAQARIAREPAFARLVAAWEERLAPLAAEFERTAPPPGVWEAIAAQLPAQTARSPRLWESIIFWRIFALAGALAAVCLAVFVYVSRPPPPAMLVASIDQGGQHHFVATIDLARGSVAVVPAVFAAEATRVPELWLIPAGGKPLPLGLLSAEHTIKLKLPVQIVRKVRPDAVLAVSLEPPGGSPTGQPTGPVIGTGKLTAM